jgi:hypothetical protein
MKQKIFRVAIALLLYASTAMAQGGVGINQPVPDPSAALDIVSETQGVLLPRLTTSAIQIISLPANGLLVYNIDDNSIYINRGTPTTPEWNNVGEDMKVGFLVYMDGAMLIDGQTQTVVEFNDIQFNHGGHYNSTFFYYVVPYDGVYQFNTGVTINGLPIGVDWLIEILVDGLPMASSVSSPASAGADFTGSASVTLNLTAGKRVYVLVEHRFPGPMFLSTNFTRSWFSGHRLY